MTPLYATPDILTKLKLHLDPFFEGFTRPTARTLTWIIIAMIAVGCVPSIRRLYSDFLEEIDIVSLNLLYHALSYAKRPPKRAFARMTAKLALSAVPTYLRKAPCFLNVDDTLIPKFGKKFDWVGMLFDHADHDGKPYKNGHCVVCIALSVPVGIHSETKRARYITVPLALCLWRKGGPSKLQIAHDQLLELRDALQDCGSFVLLADSWYPSATCSHVKFTKHGRLGRLKEPMTNWQELHCTVVQRRGVKRWCNGLKRSP